VYVCREPKDALVSYWPFTRKAAAARGLDVWSFTIQEALELFCDSRWPGGAQWLHVLQYWEESLRRPERVLFLRYEEMLLEPEAHVRKLAKFMGCEFSEEEEEDRVVSAIVISGHRAGPARHGTVMGRHGTMAIGSRRYAVPCRPCLIGLRACGPFFVPCWPVRHGKNSRPCQSTAR